MAREMERAGRPVIRLSQAVPWYGPPFWALEAIKNWLHDPMLHHYSVDPGMADVRELVCTRWFEDDRYAVDPDSELHLTCGASQAFLSALTTVADPGQRVVLTDPYYFDHLFAVQFLALEPCFVPMREDDAGFSLDLEALVREIRAGCAAVVIVDPSNPTGSVPAEDELRRIAEECAASGTALIIDETYQRITFGHGPCWHPLRERATRDVTLVVGSFSKSLGMAGWRLGYLVGPPALLRQALKVHDSVAICAPVISQVLLRESLKGPLDEWLGIQLAELRRRKEMTREAIEGSPFFAWRPVSGGIFSLLAYRGRMPSAEIAESVLRHAGVAMVPGSAFGPRGEGHLRLSFGSSSLADLEEALHRLRSLDL